MSKQSRQQKKREFLEEINNLEKEFLKIDEDKSF